MNRTSLSALGLTMLLAASATAQVCGDNEYRLFLVDQNGVPVPQTFDPYAGANVSLFANEHVYLAFDPALPSGTYYVHVTDRTGGADEVRSTNDPSERFVTVTNNAGVITLSLPLSTNPVPPVFGLGINGAGQSLPLGALHSTTEGPCRFVAWYGDNWDLGNGGSDNPYLVRSGFSLPLGRCSIRSFGEFQIGNGNGSVVSGLAFEDADRDGTRAGAETGMAGVAVTLTDGTLTLNTVTGANGAFQFPSIPAGSYTVSIAGTAGFTPTTPTSYAVEVCGCGPVTVTSFGQARDRMVCTGYPVWFWTSWHGLRAIQRYELLDLLPGLNLVDASGRRVAPGNLWSFWLWMRGANTRNMAYALSAQLVAMSFNIAVGAVSPDCVVAAAGLGRISVRELVARSIASLGADGFTRSGDPSRAQQEVLMHALRRANSNRAWSRW